MAPVLEQAKLEALAKDLEVKETALRDREDALDARAIELDAREKALSEKKDPAGRGEKTGPSKADLALVAEACKAFGIASEHVFSSGVNMINGVATAVVVTNGGVRVLYCKGDKDIMKLEPIQVDGIVRKKMKPITGKKKAK